MIRRAIKTFIADDTGATSIEYGLIAALLSLVILISLTSMRNELVTMFQDVADGFNR